MALPKLPILYSFRRCPYAMRARMALWVSGERVLLREVKLGAKPQALRDASPKATVPVLVLSSGEVIDQSFEIMLWALGRNDPDAWLRFHDQSSQELIAWADGDFKKALDRFKYPERFEEEKGYDPKARAKLFFDALEERLRKSLYLFHEEPSLADFAIFPFVRQFAAVDKSYFENLDYPQLKVWLESLLQSEIFLAIMAKFEPWVEADEDLIWGSERAGN